MSCPFCQKDHNYSIEEALSHLENGPSEVRKALEGANAEELDWPEPGGWSSRQVVTHLLDTEVVYSMRFRKIIAEDDAILPAFDQNRWTEFLTPGRDPARTLETFEHLRRDNVALLRAVTATPARLDRTGRHPEYGVLTLRDHLLHLAPHDLNHAAQIRRIREKYRR